MAAPPAPERCLLVLASQLLESHKPLQRTGVTYDQASVLAAARYDCSHRRLRAVRAPAYADSTAHGHANRNANTDLDGYRKRNSYGDPHRYRHGDANAHCNADQHGDACPDRDARTDHDPNPAASNRDANSNPIATASGVELTPDHVRCARWQ